MERVNLIGVCGVPYPRIWFELAIGSFPDALSGLNRARTPEALADMLEECGPEARRQAIEVIFDGREQLER
jgi:hypothetical protein